MSRVELKNRPKTFFSQKKIYTLMMLAFWKKNCRLLFCRNFFRRDCQICIVIVGRNTLWKKFSFRKKYFFIIFGFWGNLFGLLSKNNRQCCRKFILRVQTIVLSKNILMNQKEEGYIIVLPKTTCRWQKNLWRISVASESFCFRWTMRDEGSTIFR